MLKDTQGLKSLVMEREAERALRDCFEDVPFVAIERVESQSPLANHFYPDIQIDVGLPGGKHTLVVEAKSNGQPRVIRDAANQIQRWRQVNPDAYGVIVAPYISPEGAAICAREGIGYVDLAGNCRLTFGQVYIRRDGNANPLARNRDLRTLYSPKAARVLRVLLPDPNRSWKVQDLATEADVSLGEVSNVKKLLTDREWIKIGDPGFSVSQPDALLAEWSESYNRRRDRTVDFYSSLSVVAFEHELGIAGREEGARCALTGFSGAARLAPMVRYTRTLAYVAGDLDRLADRLDLKQVPSGANARIVVPGDEGVFYGARDFDGVPVASPIQVYLDLRTQLGRGEEAASTLLERVIRPRWERRE